MFSVNFLTETDNIRREPWPAVVRMLYPVWDDKMGILDIVGLTKRSVTLGVASLCFLTGCTSFPIEAQPPPTSAQTPAIGRWRQLTDVLDVALPSQQRRGSQRAVLSPVIQVEPSPQALIQLIERKRLLASPPIVRSTSYSPPQGLLLGANQEVIAANRLNFQASNRTLWRGY